MYVFIFYRNKVWIEIEMMSQDVKYKIFSNSQKENLLFHHQYIHHILTEHFNGIRGINSIHVIVD